MELNELQFFAHEQSREKGFWGTFDTTSDQATIKNGRLRTELVTAILSQKLALIHSEVTEALEDLREGLPYTGDEAMQVSDGGKPEGYASELADIVIRTLDLAEGTGIHLESVITTKLRYNADSRGRLHGKRF